MSEWPRVFVVVASRGEYSDRREWPVCAYPEEEAARRHCEAAAARARKLWQAVRDLQLDDWDALIDLQEGPGPVPPEWTNEHDPGPPDATDHYGGPLDPSGDPAEYALYEVDLRDPASAPLDIHEFYGEPDPSAYWPDPEAP